MKLATIHNYPYSVEIIFNDVSESFGSSHFVMSKEGNRVYLSPNKLTMQTVFADGSKFEFISGAHSYFINPKTSIPFASMEEMFNYFAEMIRSRS